MTAPTSFGSLPTLAIGAPYGFISPSDIARSDKRGTVFMHRLGGDKDRQNYGPRELREATCANLVRLGFQGPWGLGGICEELEDAANFAIAGYSWFTFDLTIRVDESADSASLDVLDSRIVALEDAGIFPIGWHEQYLSGEYAFGEETLARAAVKFGEALGHAEHLQQTIRTLMSGRDSLPDVEISIARTLRKTTPEELRFLSAELTRRGIWATVFAPSFGPESQPGLTHLETPEVAGFAEILSAAGGIRLSAPGASHYDRTDGAFFEMLGTLAKNSPSTFREILQVARESFPTARTGWNLLVTEEDIHMMPEVEEALFAEVFLGHPHGRQMLVCTWPTVCNFLGEKIRTCLAIH
jgi:hypothetical protein